MIDGSTSSAAILIADDDPANRRLLVSRLRLAGFPDVEAVESGTAALESLAARPYDLLLLDVMMPGMNGFELTRRIRKQLDEQFIPILLISALQEPEERAQGLEAGANDFLSRPYNDDELMARINALLNLKRARDELEAERSRLSLLYNISRALSSYLDYKALLRRVVALTTDLTGAAKTQLILLSREGEFREAIVARADEEPHSVNSINPHILEKGLTGWVLENIQPALVADVEQDDRWFQQDSDGTQTRSAAAVPLMLGDRLVGVLLMQSPSVNAFHQEHVDLLTAVGTQAAITLENARLLDEAREQRIRTEALLSSTGDPVLATDKDGCINRINPAAERILGLSMDMLGKSIQEVFSFSLADLLLRAKERGSAVSGEQTLRSGPNDEQLTFNVSISPVENQGFVLVWQDITWLKEGERVRLESERAETQRVLETFSRYMSPALVERVLTDRNILERRERRNAIVIFADLRGFTRLVIENSPDDVIDLLNDVFDAMMTIVYEHEGVIFDLAGDELMIGFNVPYNQPDARHRALSTVIAMQRRFIEIKEHWDAHGLHAGMGIGMDEGSVVLGHVGGRSRMNYAMVGEAVNIAHRLVELAADGQIVATPSILADGLPENAAVRVENLPPQSLKGKTDPQEAVLIEL